jgi:hypothetical protein
LELLIKRRLLPCEIITRTTVVLNLSMTQLQKHSLLVTRRQVCLKGHPTSNLLNLSALWIAQLLEGHYNEAQTVNL